jgi:O-antigen/teichoic acid export membrane protein
LKENHQTKNKRIAKNTALLYFRMIFILLVSLYTTRIILKVLGVEDYGIHNVVAGTVTMLSFLTSAISSSSLRFLSFELGKRNFYQFNLTFSTSINIQILISVLVIIIFETLGLWFINSQLNIPENRLDAANWAFQFSVLTIIVAMFRVPYNSVIISFEKMNVYAYLSIIDVLLKLILVFSLEKFSNVDSLKLYSGLLFLTSLITTLLYWLYVKKYIKECFYMFVFDKKLFKKLLNFTGWNLWGNVASITYSQGILIILNIFLGPLINSAMAIAFQVKAAVRSLILNFQTAMNPQIIKSFAENEINYMHRIIFTGSKFSYYIMLIVCLPFILNMEKILDLWLLEVPDFTIILCKLVLIEVIINSISGPLMTGAQASGFIKKYQVVVGGLLLLILPISYFFISAGYPPETTLYISIIISFIAFFARLYIISPLIMLSKIQFIKQVNLPVLYITILLVGTNTIIHDFIENDFIEIFLINFVLIIFNLIIIYFIGLKKGERLFFKNQIHSILKKNR